MSTPFVAGEQMEDKKSKDEDNVEEQNSNMNEHESDEDQHFEQSYHEAAALSEMALRKLDWSTINKTIAAAQSIGTRCRQASDSARVIAEVMVPYQETASKINAVINNTQPLQLAYPSELMGQISRTVRLFSGEMANAISASASFLNYTKTIYESLRSSIEVIQKTLAKYDTSGFWERGRDAAEKWGDLGWVILDKMPVSMLQNCPDTYPEANRLCRKIALIQLEQLRRDLPCAVRKKADAIEMFELYDAKQYKSCAMMACSLIEGEFVNWKISRSGNRKENGNPKGLTAAGGERSPQAVTLDLINVIAVHRHFFQSGRGFDRKLEGELNRNFLMHGMMNKKVTQIACVKLILLLDKVTKILPLCSIS